jgi:multidrug resistance efflux pump
LETKTIVIREREEIQSMLGKNPGFWVRNGIVILSCVIGLVLALSWVVEYPDMVTAPVTISTVQPPIRVLAPSAGKIVTLYARNNDSVSQNQLLAVLESGVSPDAVTQAGAVLAQLQQMQSPTQLSLLVIPPQLELGSLQTTWSALMNDVQTLKTRLSEDIVFQQIRSIQEEMEETRRLIESLQRQSAILQEDFALAGKNLERQRALQKQNLLSSQDLERIESAYLQQKQSLEGFSANIGTQRVRIKQLETRQSELNHDRLQELNTYWERIREKAQNMRGAMDQWALSYLVKAPISGRLNYTTPWAAQQFVQRDQELFAVVPPVVGTGQHAVAYAQLPLANAGKVQAGQAVKIWLDAYPFQEYGALVGQVVSISEIPAQTYYLVQISLPNELRTTTNFVIPNKPELAGSAKIVTRKYNVLQRIFQQFERLKRL